METGSLSRLPYRSLAWTVFFAGLIVGTLDIIAASVQIMLAGRDPVGMYKFIASGIFGIKALSGGAVYAFYGLLFHYGIAIIWTTIFFLIYPRVPFLHRHWIVAGIAYGLVVKLGMSQVVLPLSNTPPLPSTVSGFISSSLILIFAIGLPLSFLADRYFRRINA